jgi:hypothetical protein
MEYLDRVGFMLRGADNIAAREDRANTERP